MCVMCVVRVYSWVPVEYINNYNYKAIDRSKSQTMSITVRDLNARVA